MDAVGFGTFALWAASGLLPTPLSHSAMHDCSPDSYGCNSQGNNMNQDEKRRLHNLLERKRRGNIKENFDNLFDVVPCDDNEKSSRAQILHSTVRHITRLRKLIEESEAYRRKCTEDIRLMEEEVIRIQTALSRHEKPTVNPVVAAIVEEASKQQLPDYRKMSAEDRSVDSSDCESPLSGATKHQGLPPSGREQQAYRYKAPVVKTTDTKPRNLNEIVKSTRLETGEANTVPYNTTVPKPQPLVGYSTGANYLPQDSTVYGLIKPEPMYEQVHYPNGMPAQAASRAPATTSQSQSTAMPPLSPPNPR